LVFNIKERTYIHILRVFDRVLRRIFGPKREEVAGDWKSLYDEELHNLYASQILLGQSSQGG
jgi:hypothetical protein